MTFDSVTNKAETMALFPSNECPSREQIGPGNSGHNDETVGWMAFDSTAVYLPKVKDSEQQFLVARSVGGVSGAQLKVNFATKFARAPKVFLTFMT